MILRSMSALCLGFVFAACSGTLWVDDAPADDDASDDDASDDDASDDDASDDDASDDDASDDDASDDDVSDDDVGDDDDDSLPAAPGIVFDIPDGTIAGHYEYSHDAWCGTYDGQEYIMALADPHWSAGLELILEQPVQPNQFHDEDWSLYLWDGYDWGWEEGSPDCWFETGPEPWPSNTGHFECYEVYYEPYAGQPFRLDIVNGAFRCP